MPKSSPSQKLLLVKRKSKFERKRSIENPLMRMIGKFEKAHPEGADGFASSVVALFANFTRHQLNMYNAMSVDLGQLQDKKIKRLNLQEELDVLKSQNADKDVPDEENVGQVELVPEERWLPDRPNLVQEVKELMCNPPSGGITEASLIKLEFFIVRFYEATREYLNWLRRVILKINECNIPKTIQAEVCKMLKTLSRNIKNSEDNTSLTSFDRDPLSTARKMSAPQVADQVHSTEMWELSHIEGRLRVAIIN